MNTPHPDETALMDVAMARRRIETLFGRDGQIDPDEHAALSLLDGGRSQLDTSFHRRVAVESWLRNGNTDRTQRLARRADLTIIDGGGDTVITNLYAKPGEPRVAMLPTSINTKKHRHPGMDDGAA